MAHWLFKTEPTTYSIDDLAREPKRTTCWDGVRNYQARNMIRDDMRVGDDVLLYHSSTDPTGIVGLCRIVRGPYPDHTAQDRRSPYYDSKASEENPIWMMVDIQLVQRFPRIITLAELIPVRALAKMELLRRGSRLSVQPITAAEFRAILALADRTGA